jgi:hypothetical protein
LTEYSAFLLSLDRQISDFRNKQQQIKTKHLPEEQCKLNETIKEAHNTGVLKINHTHINAI